MLINTILSLCLILGYVVEYLKGGKTLPYVIGFAILVSIPIISASLIYRRNNQSHHLKYITLIGYFFAYMFAMFTTDRLIVYVYLFPIIVMYFLYFDLKLMVVLCGVVTAINVARIIYFVTVLGLKDATKTTDYTIQIVSVLLFCSALILSTRLSNRFNAEHLESIQKETQKQELILSDMLRTASILDSNSKQVNRIVDEIAQSAKIITTSVNEIKNGAEETSNSIQIQSELTHNIQGIIEQSSQLSVKTQEMSDEAVGTVNNGLTIVNGLNQTAKDVYEGNENVYREMTELKEKSNQIQTIVDTITAIAEQTNMLSLNAAIESARAGEAGRGFAVVAEEIGKLAAQSKESASDIANIISELQTKADKSVNAVTNLRSINSEQNKLIDENKKVFDIIIRKMKDVNENVGLVNKRIGEILVANNKLVDSISDVSAVSEEATASSEAAFSMTAKNIDLVNDAKKLVNELIDTSNQLTKYSL